MKKTSILDMGDRKSTTPNLQDRAQDNRRREVLRRILREVRERNADLSEGEVGKLADEAVAAVRGRRL